MAAVDNAVVATCQGTAAATAIDAEGCSQGEFCAQFDATTRDGARACKKADWKNDEPTMRVRTGRDCVIDTGTPAKGDETCVPTP
jgi:hypothetical protein